MKAPVDASPQGFFAEVEQLLTGVPINQEGLSQSMFGLELLNNPGGFHSAERRIHRGFVGFVSRYTPGSQGIDNPLATNAGIVDRALCSMTPRRGQGAGDHFSVMWLPGTWGVEPQPGVTWSGCYWQGANPLAK